MSVTVEDVANMALGILVEAPLSSLDDDTKAARLLNLHFETTRKAELTKNAWSFAIFRASLDAMSGGPTSDEYRYAYEIPEDALRVLPLTYNGEAGGQIIPWKFEGGILLTDYSGPRLVRYIGNLTDPDDWNALFVEAFAARLAMKVAMPLTQKSTILQGAKVAYDEAISEARRVNAIESSYVAGSQQWSEARGDWAPWR